jgi:hypothetical protein
MRAASRAAEVLDCVFALSGASPLFLPLPIAPCSAAARVTRTTSPGFLSAAMTLRTRNARRRRGEIRTRGRTETVAALLVRRLIWTTTNERPARPGRLPPPQPARTGVLSSAQTGELLLRLKDATPHGEFTQRCAEAFSGQMQLTELQMANARDRSSKYMRLAQIGGTLLVLKGATVRGAFTQRCAEVFVEKALTECHLNAARKRAGQYMRLAQNRAAWLPHKALRPQCDADPTRRYRPATGRPSAS